MKTKNLFIGLFLTLVMFAFVSCEKDNSLNTNPNANFNRELMDSELLSHLSDYVTSSNYLKNSKSFVTHEVACDVDVLELWYGQDFPYGVVTITDDGIDLIVKYKLYPELIEAGWSFHTTYLFIGDYDDLPYKLNENGNSIIDWYSTNVESCSTTSLLTEVVRTVPLENLDECFGIATKVKLNNPFGGQNPNPRAILLNDGLRGAYTWAESYEYCVCENDDPCGDVGTGTQGYWHKVSHWEDWGITEITIGGTTYSAAEATELIKKPGKGDKSYDMFAQLVAAKLNVLIGNCDWCIDDVIADADAWMVDHPVGSGTLADGLAWGEAGGWHYLLDEYNNGRLECASHRD